MWNIADHTFFSERGSFSDSPSLPARTKKGATKQIDTSLHEQEREEKHYWLTKTPHERLQAVETMRQVVYGYDPTSARLQRIFEVAERA